MTRRAFITRLLALGLAMPAQLIVGGCAVPLIGANARDRSAGDPWQCQNCGHLTRSRADLSGTRCPRCSLRMLKKITEAEMAEALKRAES